MNLKPSSYAMSRSITRASVIKYDDLKTDVNALFDLLDYYKGKPNYFIHLPNISLEACQRYETSLIQHLWAQYQDVEYANSNF